MLNAVTRESLRQPPSRLFAPRVDGEPQAAATLGVSVGANDGDGASRVVAVDEQVRAHAPVAGEAGQLDGQVC
ncbi:hypothetical protein VTI28DRAFT_7849 [Corynascus sepedonium]